jgi:hypothetical protein
MAKELIAKTQSWCLENFIIITMESKEKKLIGETNHSDLMVSKTWTSCHYRRAIPTTSHDRVCSNKTGYWMVLVRESL